MSRPATRRLPGWETLLAEAVQRKLREPFQWGANDCCTMAADLALAITGRDPAAPWRGRCRDEMGAELVLAERGGLEATIAAAMEAFGAPEIPPALAQRGDWATVLVGNQLHLGVVMGRGVLVAGMDGARQVPLRWAMRAWAI